MKIKPEELAKIVEEEAYKILEEVWMPGQTMDKIAGDLARLGPLKEPKEKPTEKPETEPPEHKNTLTNIQKIIQRTNPAVLPIIKNYFLSFRLDEKLSKILYQARIDNEAVKVFKKDIIKFLENLEKYRTLEEDLKTDLLLKRKLIQNLDPILKKLESTITKQITSIISKDIIMVSRGIYNTAFTKGVSSQPGMESFLKDVKFSSIRPEKYREFPRLQQQQKEAISRVLKVIGEDVLAVSLCVSLLTRQSITNAYGKEVVNKKSSETPSSETPSSETPSSEKTEKFNKLKDILTTMGADLLRKTILKDSEKYSKGLSPEELVKLEKFLKKETDEL